jgi:Cys-rich protein (TIGR01571 family)
MQQPIKDPIVQGPMLVIQEPSTEKRAWRASLCGCLLDLGSCTLSFLLPAVLFGMNQERAFHGESCCKWFLLFVLPPVLFEAAWYLLVGPHFLKWLERTGHKDDDCRRISLSFDAFRLVCWVLVMAWVAHLRAAPRCAPS